MKYLKIGVHQFLLSALASATVLVQPARADRFSWELEVSNGTFNDPNSWHGPNYPEHTRFPGGSDDATIGGSPTVRISGDQSTDELVTGNPTFDISGSYTVQNLFGQGSPLTVRGAGSFNVAVWQLGAQSILDGVLADTTTLQPLNSSPPSELTIRNNASFTSQTVDTSQGGLKVVVDGLGSTWKHASQLPFSQVVLRNGGRGDLSTTDGIFLDADGIGSLLTVSGRFSGYGRIANGARVQSAEGLHTGQFTTIDAGTWSVSGRYVNDGANITIQNGGVLSANDVRAGEFGSDTIVTGAGSRFEVANLLTYLGSVQLKSGGALITREAQLDKGGVYAESGATFTVGERLSGNFGISMFSGSSLSAKEVFLADIAGKFGSLTIDGAGSRAQIAQALAVGQLGEGSLTVRNKGRIDSGKAGLGLFAGSSGDVQVDGVLSSWQINSPGGGGIIVGGAGKGNLTVRNGATLSLSTVGQVRLGEESGGEGTVRVADFGSDANLRLAELIVGQRGKGTLQIDNGGSLEASFVEVGQSLLPNQATVSGQDSILGVLGQIVVGDGGQGALLVQQGGKGIFQRLLVGKNSQADNFVSVEGAGSALRVSDRIDVGTENGRGRLQMTGTAEAHPNGGMGVGIYPGSKGELVIDKNAFILTFEPVIIGGGYGSQATATVKGGGSLDARHLLVFAKPNGTSSFEVTGELSSIEVNEDVQIGFTREPSGPAVLRAGPGAFVSVGTNLVVGRQGRLENTGARIKVGGAEFPPQGTVRIGPGGRLSGVGRVVGKIEVLNGGRVSPGSSPGTLTIEGDFTQTGGRLEMEVAGTSADAQFDVLHVTGNATMGGTLALSFIDNFAPKKGQQFAILQADGGITGDFASVEIAGLAPGFNYTTAKDNTGQLILTAQTDGIATSPARLEISASGNSLNISWSSAGNWSLESTASLAGATWLPVPSAPVRNGDRWTVTLPVGAGSSFFRLRQ